MIIVEVCEHFYLPSVQSPALSCVTTAVPADPVKPVMKALALKCSISGRIGKV